MGSIPLGSRRDSGGTQLQRIPPKGPGSWGPHHVVPTWHGNPDCVWVELPSPAVCRRKPPGPGSPGTCSTGMVLAGDGGRAPPTPVWWGSERGTWRMIPRTAGWVVMPFGKRGFGRSHLGKRDEEFGLDVLSLGGHGEASHWCKQLVDGIWNSGEGCGLETQIWGSFGWRCSQSHGVRGSHGIIRAKRKELGNTSIYGGGKLKRHPRSNRRGKGHTKSTQETERGRQFPGWRWLEATGASERRCSKVGQKASIGQ